MWKLTADNYMPRKSCLSGEASYAVLAKDRATLVALVHKYWLPLYKAAVNVLTELKQAEDDGTAQLYYWSED